MKLQEVFRRDRIEYGDLPIYDKDWNARAFIVLGDNVIEVKHGCRVTVPMNEDDGTSHAKLLALIRTVAELGEWVDYEGNFDVIQSYFRSKDLPFGAVVKNPRATLQPPADVVVFDHASVLEDRFYCLTPPEKLGIIPFTPGLIICNVQCPESLGFVLYETRGVLTAFL